MATVGVKRLTKSINDWTLFQEHPWHNIDWLSVQLTDTGLSDTLTAQPLQTSFKIHL